MSTETGKAATGRMTTVHVAPDAVMSIPAGDLEWMVRYGRVDSVRYLAASVIESYSCLVGPEITTKEAIRRLRILRAASTADKPEEQSHV